MPRGYSDHGVGHGWPEWDLSPRISRSIAQPSVGPINTEEDP